jgi:hypothetical protein
LAIVAGTIAIASDPVRSLVKKTVSVVILTAFVCFGAGVTYWRHNTLSTLVAADASNPTIDGLLQFACEEAMIPETFPGPDRPYILDTITPAMPFTVTTMTPGAPPAKWSTEGAAIQGKCTFSNFGKDPLVNVQIDMKVEYLSVVQKDKTSMSSGGILKSFDVRSPPLNVKSGSIAEFYFLNLGPYFIQVTYPDYTWAQPVGSTQSRKANLITIPYGITGLYLTPNLAALAAINPPAASPPSPEPPTLPEGK